MALERIDKMPQSAFDEIVEKYVEMILPVPSEKEMDAVHAFSWSVFSNENSARL